MDIYNLLLFPFQNHERPVEKLLKYMLDVAMGMHYISCQGLVHRVSFIGHWYAVHSTKILSCGEKLVEDS